MARWIGMVAAGMSLAMGLAAAGVWVRSYWVGNEYYRSRWTVGAVPGRVGVVRTHETAIFLISGRGGLAVEMRLQDGDWAGDVEKARVDYAKGETEWRTTKRPAYPEVVENRRSLWNVMGFGYWSAYYAPGNTGSSRRVWAPAWAVVVVLMASPGWWVMRAVKKRRRREGNFCAGCGYDLRASPERCPECGREVGTEVKGS